VATRPHAERNRAMFLTMLYAALRVKECASLRYADVLDAEGKIKAEIYLSAEQTKGSKTGTVFVSDKLRKELQAYVRAVSQLRTSFSIHKSVQQRDGTVIHYANTFTIYSKIAELVVLVVTVQDVQLLPIWLTKALALGCYKALLVTPT
jgi:integrase